MRPTKYYYVKYQLNMLPVLIAGEEGRRATQQQVRQGHGESRILDKGSSIELLGPYGLDKGLIKSIAKRVSRIVVLRLDVTGGGGLK